MSEDTILIADDSTLICDHFATLLSNLGFTSIIKAYNGDQAVAACKGSEVSLAFIDICMPKLDGIEVLMQIMKSTPDLYVVMISGSGTVDNVKTCIKNGAKGFIVKPCSTQKIEDAVANYHTFKRIL